MSLMIYTLDLRAPFLYSPNLFIDPFSQVIYEEQVACFSLDKETAGTINPDPANYLGPLLFTGAKPDTENLTLDAEKGCSIPKGLYLFAQLREGPERDLFNAMAIEVQKEGLWRRLDLEPIVYIRTLKEETELVTQVLRPIRSASGQQQ